jgi:predicted HTH domain antitoxin
MTTVKVPVPDELFSNVRRTPDEVADEMRLALAIRWYAQGLISQGAGASLAGLSRSAFLDALSAAGVSPFQEALEEIRESARRG